MSQTLYLEKIGVFVSSDIKRWFEGVAYTKSTTFKKCHISDLVREALEQYREKYENGQ